MKSILFALIVFLYTPLCGQSITGKWVAIDDETGDQTSVVEIYKRDGLYFGKIVKIFPKAGEDVDPLCKKCATDDPRHGKKIIGMEIIRALVQDGGEYSGGDILDPRTGKLYKCKIWIEGPNLKVRGYWGPFFRTQAWKRTD